MNDRKRRERQKETADRRAINVIQSSFMKKQCDIETKRCAELGIEESPSFDTGRGLSKILSELGSNGIKDFNEYWYKRFVFYACDKETAYGKLEFTICEKQANKYIIGGNPLLTYSKRICKTWWQTFTTFMALFFIVETFSKKAENTFRLCEIATLRYYHSQFRLSRLSFMWALLGLHEVLLAKTDCRVSEYLAKKPKTTRLPFLLRARYSVLFYLHKWYFMVEDKRVEVIGDANLLKKDLEKADKEKWDNANC